MRAMMVLALLLAGCLSSGGDAESNASAEPNVSVTYSRIRMNDEVRISASLDSVQGPIDDWGDLNVNGCVAPPQGPIETPHAFSSCSGHLTIRYAPTGQTLYSSR